MFTDFVINFDFKNGWVIAIWKFQLWINLQEFSTYMWQIDPKSKFSNGYNSVIFKVKIYDKISKHWELPHEFKNPKKIQIKFGKIFKKYLKIGDFRNYLFSIIKNRQFSNTFLKIIPNFFLKYFCIFRAGWHLFKYSEIFKMISLQMTEL